MKTLAILVLAGSIIFPSAGQVVSNVNWELEGDERIVITYDLAKVDNSIYFNVSVKVKIDNEIINARALSGDVGNFVKAGTSKKIVWNIFEDISDLNGALSVEVIAFNPVPSTSDTDTDKDKDVTPSPAGKMAAANIPFWAGMGGTAITGVLLLTNGSKSAGEGTDLYEIYRNNTVETSAVYAEMGTSRDDVYNEANKKYKNGTLLQVAGGAVLVTAGVIIVNRIIQAKKMARRAVAVSPYINIDPNDASGKLTMNTGLTFRVRLH